MFTYCNRNSQSKAYIHKMLLVTQINYPTSNYHISSFFRRNIFAHKKSAIAPLWTHQSAIYLVEYTIALIVCALALLYTIYSMNTICYINNVSAHRQTLNNAPSIITIIFISAPRALYANSPRRRRGRLKFAFECPRTNERCLEQFSNSPLFRTTLWVAGRKTGKSISIVDDAWRWINVLRVGI